MDVNLLIASALVRRPLARRGRITRNISSRTRVVAVNDGADEPDRRSRAHGSWRDRTARAEDHLPSRDTTPQDRDSVVPEGVSVSLARYPADDRLLENV